LLSVNVNVVKEHAEEEDNISGNPKVVKSFVASKKQIAYKTCDLNDKCWNPPVPHIDVEDFIPVLILMLKHNRLNN